MNGTLKRLFIAGLAIVSLSTTLVLSGGAQSKPYSTHNVVMLSFSGLHQGFVETVSLTGSMRNSTFARRRSAEAAAEERMRAQREARLQQPQTNNSHSVGIPFISSVRFPQRWTDE